MGELILGIVDWGAEVYHARCRLPESVEMLRRSVIS
jgi:hypothetical protein